MFTINDLVIEGLSNPFIPFRADPWIYKHKDGYYYFTGTVPDYDLIELRRSKTLAELEQARPVNIWHKHPTGMMGSHIWAPEIHYLDNKWYIYFAAGDSKDTWNIHKYVLENSSDNPLQGEWIEKGRIDTGQTHFTLDATVFECNNKRYLVWAQKPDSTPDISNLYIAEMESPWCIKGEPLLLSQPEFSWEQHLHEVNEGPAVLIRNGKVFLTYSASGTDHHYCMGMLIASVTDDLLNVDSWKKSSDPVFKSSEDNHIYGPGHNSFTKSEDDSEDYLVYHARNYKNTAGDPLDDPNRHTRIQKILWDEKGYPILGKPIPESR
ncbi:glycoside hydrolase family 43 protein [Spirochaeta cellobiosiphila]|uniref:glycoside hydrolase family 43 protein n=1 Tax=Spirochaeta cellobiosiphila TaxID=504483 RepID=UPI0003F670D0|nr:glycoside hydrolase family 43 protein [Spirochaeta cellobiosiphila]